MRELRLPAGFKETELGSIEYEHGDQILRYCQSCRERKDCKMNKTLRSAMGNNFPYWAKNFRAVEVPKSEGDIPWRENVVVMCDQYKSPQLTLSGIRPSFSDAVQKILDNLERAKVLEAV